MRSKDFRSPYFRLTEYSPQNIFASKHFRIRHSTFDIRFIQTKTHKTPPPADQP